MLSNCTVAATLPYKGLESAEEFYSDKLGLQLVSGSVDEGYLEFGAGDGSVIQLFESDSSKSNDTAATFEVEDLAREMEELRNKNVSFEEFNLPSVQTDHGVASMDGHMGAWIKDPSGNILALHQAK